MLRFTEFMVLLQMYLLKKLSIKRFSIKPSALSLVTNPPLPGAGQMPFYFHSQHSTAGLVCIITSLVIHGFFVGLVIRSDFLWPTSRAIGWNGKFTCIIGLWAYGRHFGYDDVYHLFINVIMILLEFSNVVTNSKRN